MTIKKNISKNIIGRMIIKNSKKQRIKDNGNKIEDKQRQIKSFKIKNIEN